MSEKVKSITDGIEETYSWVFKKNYTYDEETLNYSRNLVRKDLERINIKNLEGMTAINVGTGSESIAIAELGAQKVYHIDISSVAVNSMTRYIKNNNIKNISTNLFDLCSNENMRFIEGECDIIYLNGVLQHLYNPKQAIENIAKNMKKGGKIFIRTYRNESWLFFVVSLLRKLFKYTDKSALIKCCKENSNGKDIFNDLFVCEMFDDIFVPVINIYSYKELVSFFEQIGFEEIKISDQKITENGIPYVEKEDTEESIMIAFSKNETLKYDTKIDFPMPKDQLSNFKENNQIQELLVKFDLLEKIISKNIIIKEEVPSIIYDLYHFASFRRERNDNLDSMIKEMIGYINKIIV